MPALLRELKTSVIATVVLAVATCALYPLAVFAGAQLLFPAQANGSLIRDRDGTIRGSALLAQNFSSAKYFHPRPSAAGSGYDAGSSSGTNLGPTSQKLADSIKAAVATYRAENRLAVDVPVPADAVTSSGSGLDPHISPANAELQAARVARARNLPLERIRQVIGACTDERDLGLLGERSVNVLKLNRALDNLRP